MLFLCSIFEWIYTRGELLAEHQTCVYYVQIEIISNEEIALHFEQNVNWFEYQRNVWIISMRNNV
mgnify:CR=1 FL=1